MVTNQDAPSSARTSGRAAYASGRSTREAMIITAERLFAERGFDAVSLREIAAESGTRNSGAAQYYFGDKEGLVQAIFEYRASALNERRAAMLAQAAHWQDGVRGAMEATIRPLAEQIGTGCYVSFLARLQADHVRDQRVRTGGPQVDASFRQAREELRRHLLDLAYEVFRRRFRFGVRMSIAALGEFERSRRADHAAAGGLKAREAESSLELEGQRRRDHGSASPEAESLELEALIIDLVDAAAGMLRAPSTRAR